MISRYIVLGFALVTYTCACLASEKINSTLKHLMDYSANGRMLHDLFSSAWDYKGIYFDIRVSMSALIPQVEKESPKHIERKYISAYSSGCIHTEDQQTLNMTKQLAVQRNWYDHILNRKHKKELLLIKLSILQKALKLSDFNEDETEEETMFS